MSSRKNDDHFLLQFYQDIIRVTRKKGCKRSEVSKKDLEQINSLYKELKSCDVSNKLNYAKKLSDENFHKKIFNCELAMNSFFKNMRFQDEDEDEDEDDGDGGGNEKQVPKDNEKQAPKDNTPTTPPKKTRASTYTPPPNSRQPHFPFAGFGSPGGGGRGRSSANGGRDMKMASPQFALAPGLGLLGNPFLVQADLNIIFNGLFMIFVGQVEKDSWSYVTLLIQVCLFISDVNSWLAWIPKIDELPEHLQKFATHCIMVQGPRASFHLINMFGSKVADEHVGKAHRSVINKPDNTLAYWLIILPDERFKLHHLGFSGSDVTIYRVPTTTRNKRGEPFNDTTQHDVCVTLTWYVALDDGENVGMHTPQVTELVFSDSDNEEDAPTKDATK